MKDSRILTPLQSRRAIIGSESSNEFDLDSQPQGVSIDRT